MDPVVFKKENRRKENTTSSTLIAPNPCHYFHSEPTVFRAKGKPGDAAGTPGSL